MTDRAELITQFADAFTELYRQWGATIAALEAKPEPAKPEPRVIPKDQQWCGACKGLGTVAVEPAKPLPECPECFGKGAITMSDGVSSHPCTLCEDKPLPAPVKHAYEYCVGSIKGCVSHYRGETPDCPDCKEPAKPSIMDYGNADEFTLSEPAKPLPEVCCGDYRSCLRPCTPRGRWQAAQELKPLPESDEQWIQKWRVKEGGSVWMLFASDVRAYLTQLHSQHQAELELLRSKLALVLRENRRLSDELKKVDAELAAAKEQGRREALQAVPVDALTQVYRAADEYHHNIVIDDEGTEVGRRNFKKGVDALFDLIESAREEAARQAEPAQEKT